MFLAFTSEHAFCIDAGDISGAHREQISCIGRIHRHLLFVDFSMDHVDAGRCHCVD